VKQLLAFAKGFVAGLFGRRKKTITVIPPTAAEFQEALSGIKFYDPVDEAEEIAASLGHGIQATVLTPDQFCQMYDCLDAFELQSKRKVAEIVTSQYEPNSCEQSMVPIKVDGVQVGILHYARIGQDFFFFKERFSGGDLLEDAVTQDGFLDWNAKVDALHDEFWDRIHGEGENE
jgi:hypothetical protein